MPEIVLFRPRLSRLLDELKGDNPGGLLDVNLAIIERATGVNRATLHNWLNRDVDDPELWLLRYDPENARRLSVYFSEVLGRPVDIMERIVIDDSSPRIQEMATVAA